MVQVELRINGADNRRAIDRTLPGHLLRGELDLKRTHAGCDTIERRAGTVKLNGAAAKDQS